MNKAVLLLFVVTISLNIIIYLFELHKLRKIHTQLDLLETILYSHKTVDVASIEEEYLLYYAEKRLNEIVSYFRYRTCQETNQQDTTPTIQQCKK